MLVLLFVANFNNDQQGHEEEFLRFVYAKYNVTPPPRKRKASMDSSSVSAIHNSNINDGNENNGSVTPSKPVGNKEVCATLVHLLTLFTSYFTNSTMETTITAYCEL